MRINKAIINSIVILLCQIFDIFLSFVLRKLLIVYIGIDFLGVSGTFASILETIALIEMGFDTAVTYFLYKPIYDHDEKKISDIIMVIRRVYFYIGVLILLIGVGLSFFLTLFINGIAIDYNIYILFYIQLMASAVPYFFAHYKIYIYALQKDYIIKINALILVTIFSVYKIVVVIWLNDFIIVSAIGLLCVILENNILKLICVRRMKLVIERGEINKQLVCELKESIKNVACAKFAGYVYSSTDNIIISVCVGTTSVALLGNYTGIIYKIKNVLSNMFGALTPILGELLIDLKNNGCEAINKLNIYTFVRFFFFCVFCIPALCLCDFFVAVWLGNEFILSKSISVLLIIDVYVHIVHGGLVDFINAAGLFSYEKKYCIIGAVLNIICSIICVKSYGIIGVLFGTIVSQIYFWISRSYLVFMIYYRSNNIVFLKYWARIALYSLFVFFAVYINGFILNSIKVKNNMLSFFVLAGVCMCITFGEFFFVWFKTKEFKYIINIIKIRMNNLRKK